MFRIVVVMTGGLIGAFIAQPALAVSPDADFGSSLVACRQIDDEHERLGCFDAAMDARYGVDEDLRVRRERRKLDAFGFPSNSNGSSLLELKAAVRFVDEDLRSGQVTLELDNGQVWRTTAVGGLRRFRQGDAVTVTEGKMGGHRLKIEGSNGFRGVVRVR